MKTNPKEKQCKNIVLCFDGTRENFGPQPITNVLKLYQILDNCDDTVQMCYYQPGVGTEADFDPVVDIRRRFTLSHFRNITDSMFASSVDHHVVSGYIFLMEHYNAGDKIFMFGFSRGAFIARALAGMLERVGLVNRGLTEMVSMAWRIYEKWEFAEQPSQPNYNTTLAEEFKRTFSRSYEIRVHFQGLWDSVNSVGILRDRLFPCTQRSGIVDHVRHAVSLDERKGKFKQQSFAPSPYSCSIFAPDYGSYEDHESDFSGPISSRTSQSPISVNQSHLDPFSSKLYSKDLQNRALYDDFLSLQNSKHYKSCIGSSELDMTTDHVAGSPLTYSSRFTLTGTSSTVTPDLIEKWFPGDHSDIGGGWRADCTTRENISNLPLRWMIAEAVKHGVKFKPGSVHEFSSKYTNIGSLFSTIHDKLSFQRGTKVGPLEDEIGYDCQGYPQDQLITGSSTISWFRKLLTDLLDSKRKEKLTDEEVARESYSAVCRGVSIFETVLWWILEFIPIGLRLENEAGKWRNVYIPNLGRPRYVPLNGDIHWSVYWRIKYDKRYRPANLPDYARKLLEEFEEIDLSTPTLANMHSIASPFKSYPKSLSESSALKGHRSEEPLEQSLPRSDDLTIAVAGRTAESHYMRTKKCFSQWSASSWQDFPDDLQEVLSRYPSL